jgi:hypothetical protein
VVPLSLLWFVFPGAVLFWCTVVTFGVEVIGLIVLGIRIVPPLVQASVGHSEPVDVSLSSDVVEIGIYRGIVRGVDHFVPLATTVGRDLLENGVQRGPRAP